ncbi:MAG: response regulator [Syntrophobacteraceae bacterium]|nr:response regulator [Syntrophobacteraceae bacterium]
MECMPEETIFVVDDDQGVLESFDAMLGDDYCVVMLHDGMKALDLLTQRRPRLLFLDIKMPGFSGLDLLKAIRERHLAIEVVIVTALPQDKYEEMAREYGVYRYLRKPLDVDEIEGITRTVLH